MRTFAEKPPHASAVLPSGFMPSRPAPQAADTRIALNPRHDFSSIPMLAPELRADPAGVLHENEENDQSGGGSGAAPAPAPATSSSPITVDQIAIIDSPTGAIGGYPAITSGDLNTPGPFNNPANGAVNNVHQIHFHLDQGDSVNVTPRRELQRSAWRAGVERKNPADQPLPPGQVGPPTPGGFHGVLVGPDGPPPHEIQRPTTDTIVIADAPGAASIAASEYPYAYRSHFRLTLYAGGTDIALIRYDVNIEKTSATNIPNAQNSITSVTKEDLVRGRSLP